MNNLLLIVHIIVCLFLVAVVLLQHGKGADIGATFGGSSQSLFGTEGPLPLLNKITTAAAIIFMLTSLTLAYISSQTGSKSIMSDVGITTKAALPIAKEKAADEKPTEPAKENGVVDKAPKQ
jgi:preprotein translocase subunit SecG